MKKQTTTVAKAQGAKAKNPKQNNKQVPKKLSEAAEVAEVVAEAPEVVASTEPVATPTVETVEVPVPSAPATPPITGLGSKFEGPTDDLEKIVVDKNIASVGWNQHLPNPLQPDEVVFKHPDQTGVANGYVKIIHGDVKNIAVFSYHTLKGAPVQVAAQTYTPTTTKPFATVETAEAKPATAPKVPAPKEEKPKSGIVFMDKVHSKSGAVLAVVKHYVETNPGTTVEKLKEVFPDTLLKRFGIFQEVSKAKEIANGGNRYFFKPEHEIKLADEKTVVVCNQITSDNVKPFVEASRALGFTLTVQD
jgi:hypothetical protein